MPIARFYAMPMLMQTHSCYACARLFKSVPMSDAASTQMPMLMLKEQTP